MAVESYEAHTYTQTPDTTLTHQYYLVHYLIKTVVLPPPTPHLH